MTDIALDPKALEKAAEAYENSPCMDLIGPMGAAITAYLEATGRVPVEDLGKAKES